MSANRFTKPRGIVVIQLLLASVLLLLLVACGSSAPPTAESGAAGEATPVPQAAATPVPEAAPTDEPPAPAAGEPRYGGIVNMHSYAFPTPNWTPYEGTNHIMNNSGIYNQLLEYNPETEDLFDIRGDLAVSWEVAADGVTWTFTITKDAVFQDGTPVTSEDVVYSVDSMVDPEAVRSQLAGLKLYYQPGNVRAIDDYTVEIKTKAPAADFIATLSADWFKILPKHLFESRTDMTRWENQMGSGPFTPSKLVKDVSIRLEKNPNYWKEGLPYIDGMEHFTVADKGTAIANYKTGQLLVSSWAATQLSNEEVNTLVAESDDLNVHFIPNGTQIGLVMNTTVEPFDDPRVRRAISIVLDRPLFRNAFAGPDASLGAPMPPGTWYGRTPEELLQIPGFRVTEDGQKHPDDIALAQSLMAEAGLADGFEIDMMARQVIEFVDVAQLEAEQLKKHLNIEFNILPIDSPTGLARYAEGDFNVAPQGFAPNISEPDGVITVPWIPGGIVNGWSRWQPPPEFLELNARQSTELDRTKRAAIIREMEDYLLFEDPGGFIGLYWNLRDSVVNTKIHNYHTSPNLFSQLKYEHIWCDPAC